MKIAAVHMDAAFGDVIKNMDNVKNKIKEAKTKGAELILFPEFFTTGFAFSNKLYDSVLKYDDPQDKLNEYAKEYNIIIGGSYLKLRNNNVYNTFTLTFPDGQVFEHSKDIPTLYEHFIYTYGDENNVLETPIGNIGVALCWEQIRYNTLKRMVGKVDFVLAGSCWWGFSENDPKALQDLNKIHNEMAVNAPIEIAKKLNVPVIHASYNAKFQGVTFPSGDKEDVREIMGATQVIDRNGKVVSRKLYNEKTDIIIEDIDFDIKNRPKNTIDTNEYWVPKMPDVYLYGWKTISPKVEEYYNKISKQIYLDKN